MKKNYHTKLNDAISKGKNIGPKIVMISPTDSCNLTCQTCWRLEKDEDPNKWKSKELKFNEIIGILDDCKELAVEAIDCTGGGEPFLRKDMFKIIKEIKKRGFFATLTTNGTVLNKTMIKQLIDIGLDDICFSLDGADAKTNDVIRGKGVFEKAVNSIELFQKVKNKSHVNKPVIRLGTVITQSNYDRLENLGKLAKRLGICSINFSVLLEWSSNKQLSLRDIDEKKLVQALQRLKKTLQKYGIASNIEPIIKHGLFEHNPPDFCFAPWQMAFINAQGDMLACCILASFYENKLGNARDSGFKQLWFSPKMEKFRQRINQKKFYKGCNRCLPQFVENFNKLAKEMKL